MEKYISENKDALTNFEALLTGDDVSSWRSMFQVYDSDYDNFFSRFNVRQLNLWLRFMAWYYDYDEDRNKISREIVDLLNATLKLYGWEGIIQQMQKYENEFDWLEEIEWQIVINAVEWLQSKDGNMRWVYLSGQGWDNYAKKEKGINLLPVKQLIALLVFLERQAVSMEGERTLTNPDFIIED